MNKIIYASLLALIIMLNFCADKGSPDKDNVAQNQTEVPKVDLHQAIIINNIDLINKHIYAGSDVNVLEPSRGSTPLITASAVNNLEAARILIEAGADLNHKNRDGSTALLTAIVFGNTDLAKLLIESGADLDLQNNEGSTALHTASFFCREGVVKLLLSKGADKSIKNKSGKTPLETVESPFEKVKVIYDSIGESLRPLGIKLDYEHIRKTRPLIAELLKSE